MTGMAAVYVFLAAIVFCAILVSAIITRARRRHVKCPETGRQVEVACDPAQALKATLMDTRQRVVDCDRWPERADCDRACEARLGPEF
jgi:Na+-transporting methylmalonyl-CoA/oxaloacetate decarboxylase gamma subunit